MPPLRGERLCHTLTPIGPVSAGELLGEIVDGDPIRQFAGYHGNQKATEKKILRNVFCEGDKYFRTGDLLQQDQQGYIHFIDRCAIPTGVSALPTIPTHGFLGVGMQHRRHLPVEGGECVDDRGRRSGLSVPWRSGGAQPSLLAPPINPLTCRARRPMCTA